MRSLNILTSIDLADCGDSDWGPDVNVSGEGGTPSVVPILIVGGQLL